jgi:hypothetical protein
MIRPKTLSRFLLIAVLVVIISWISIPLLIFTFYGQAENAGVFGDTFGVVNALFSALAFAFLIYTALMQREELELQRKELTLTRKEIEKSAEAQNMLVSLTREQLELDKAIRKNQIKPELIKKEVKPIAQQNSESKYMIQINLSVKFNRLKLFRLEVSGEVYDFKINEDWHHMTMSKFYEPNEELFVIIESPRKTVENPIGLIVEIYFEDVDTRTYKQSFTFSKEGNYLSNSQDYSLINFLR